jgi:hypothetical protein
VKCNPHSSHSAAAGFLSDTLVSPRQQPPLPPLPPLPLSYSLSCSLSCSPPTSRSSSSKLGALSDRNTEYRQLDAIPDDEQCSYSHSHSPSAAATPCSTETETETEGDSPHRHSLSQHTETSQHTLSQSQRTPDESIIVSRPASQSASFNSTPSPEIKISTQGNFLSGKHKHKHKHTIQFRDDTNIFPEDTATAITAAGGASSMRGSSKSGTSLNGEGRTSTV